MLLFFYILLWSWCKNGTVFLPVIWNSKLCIRFLKIYILYLESSGKGFMVWYKQLSQAVSIKYSTMWLVVKEVERWGSRDMQAVVPSIPPPAPAAHSRGGWLGVRPDVVCNGSEPERGSRHRHQSAGTLLCSVSPATQADAARATAVPLSVSATDFFLTISTLTNCIL